jgi:tetratricopeptide (TPR) repeat protein
MPPRLAYLTLLASAVAAIAGSAPNQEQIRQLYNRGVAGEKTAVDQCIAQLEAALKVEPNNQLARVYLGSAYTLRSRDLGIGPAKLEALNRGLGVMDAAVAAAPNDARVRLVRALTTQSLPFFLGRGKPARDDFETLVTLVNKDPQALESGDLQTVYYNAGVAADRAGNHTRAVELWKMAAAHPVDPPLAAKVNAALAKR